MDTDRLLTPEEIAERLQVQRSTVMDYLRRGIIKGKKIGRLWRISLEDLEKYLREAGEAKDQ